MSGLVRRRLSSRIGVLGVAVVAAVGAFAGSASAQATAGARRHAAHVSIRATARRRRARSRPAQTPNVDKLMPTINWTTEAEFGADDNFQSTVLGEPERRDGRQLHLPPHQRRRLEAEHRRRGRHRPRRPARRHLQGGHRHADRGLPRPAHRLLRGAAAARCSSSSGRPRARATSSSSRTRCSPPRPASCASPRRARK